jgi:hypothetical protein
VGFKKGFSINGARREENKYWKCPLQSSSMLCTEHTQAGRPKPKICISTHKLENKN